MRLVLVSDRRDNSNPQSSTTYGATDDTQAAKILRSNRLLATTPEFGSVSTVECCKIPAGCVQLQCVRLYHVSGRLRGLRGRTES